MNVIIDLDKLSYTTLERIGRDYGYEGVDEIVDKLEEDTNRFKKELKEAVIDCFKNIKVEISK